MKSLYELGESFMLIATGNMGKFSSFSRKKIILEGLLVKLRKEKELNNPKLKLIIAGLIRNFISVAIMNRYTTRAKNETHSGRVCLDLLNKSEYCDLKLLLFPQNKYLTYGDLLNISVSSEFADRLTTSSCCIKSLYEDFGITKGIKEVPEAKLNLAANGEIVYKPTIKMRKH